MTIQLIHDLRSILTTDIHLTIASIYLNVEYNLDQNYQSSIFASICVMDWML